MWQSRCTSPKALKLSCCLSCLFHFGWTLTTHICGLERNLPCLGSKGGRLKEMRTAAHSRKCLWEIYTLQAKRMSVLRCAWEGCKPSRTFVRAQAFGCFRNSLQLGRRELGSAKVQHSAEPFLLVGCFFLLLLLLVPVGWFLFLFPGFVVFNLS